MSLQGYFETGPYKGYHGRAEYDADDELFQGELIGIRDVITFAGKTPKQLEQAFRESVDDYLAWCSERKKEPHKPFSGTFLVRATPELHRNLSNLAEAQRKSLNSLVVECLESAAQEKPRPRPARRKAV